MYFEVNLTHMFLINLCLAHQNVVLRRKAHNKNRVMLQQPLMKSTPEDCSLVRNSDRLRAPAVPCSSFKTKCAQLHEKKPFQFSDVCYLFVGRTSLLFQLAVIPLLSCLVFQLVFRFFIELRGEEARLWQRRISVHGQEACSNLSLQNGQWEFDNGL